MGTDVHGVWQRRKVEAQTWEDVPSAYEQGRHYQLFAVLANVRNGYGFAGVPTGQAVKPISEPRGFPEDFLRDGDEHPIAALELMDPRRQKYHETGETLEVWMGDHSHSWLSGEELLAWWKDAPEVVKTGIMCRDLYNAWDGCSTPDYFSGGISGPGIIVVNDNAPEKEANPLWTHIRCTWTRKLSEELAYFFEEVQRLAKEHGEIRFVFGFDS